jgi:hypothetical protein
MWTPELVKIRFVEAAGTERFLTGLRKPEARGYWPEFVYDEDDRAGWDQKARDDHMEIWQGRGTAKADALSRYQECLTWTIERITDPRRRQLVWAFAFCRAYKRDFGETCKKRGWVKSTAYNRLNRVWQELSWHFNNEGVLLREPAQFWIGHETPDQASISAMMARGADVPQPIKFTPGFRTEASRHLLKDDDAVADFQAHLDAVNADRRRLQEREAKRRAKIGAMAS